MTEQQIEIVKFIMIWLVVPAVALVCLLEKGPENSGDEGESNED